MFTSFREKREFLAHRMLQAQQVMRDRNGGDITTEDMFHKLEVLLGNDGVDMLALWGMMVANEATTCDLCSIVPASFIRR